MAETWGPTANGLSFTSTPVWKLTLEGERYALSLGQQLHRGSVKELHGLTVEPGLIWATVLIPAAGGRAAVKVDGIPNQAAVEMLGAVEQAAKELQRKQYLKAMTDQFEPFAVQVAKWSSSVNAAMKREFKRRGWLGREFLEALEGTTPTFPEEALREALCDISNSFVQRNPKQLRKSVRSTNLASDEPVRLIQVPSEYQIPSAVRRRLADLAAEASAAGKRRKVFVLGRYNNDRRFVPAEYGDSMLDVEFLTVHSSKGLEADYVVLPRVTSETLGFPSRVADDPVLQLAMPGGDAFEYAEERRLFYVALTRARLNVTLISLEGRDSPFVTELVGDANIPVHQADGAEASATVCPVCQQGFMVRRRGPYGQFLGCSTFRRCRHRVSLAPNPGRTSPNRTPARGSTR